MKLNRELRTDDTIARNRRLWFLFYLAVFTGMFTLMVLLFYDRNEPYLPSGNIDLHVAKTHYQLGESIEFTVTNHSKSTIYVVNQCPNEPLHVFRWNEKRWDQISAKVKNGDDDCFRQPRNVPIDAEGSLTYDFDDWPELFNQPGVYRIVMTVDHATDMPFQDFVVMQPAEVIEEPIPELPQIEFDDDRYEHEYEYDDD